MSDLYDKTKLEKRFKNIDSNLNLLKQKILGTARASDVYPKRASWWFIDGIGTALERNANYTGMEYQALWYSSPANDGDSWTFSAVLAAGSYTFYTIGRSNTGNAILDYYLDGVAIETGQDWYSGSAANNVTKSFTFSVPASGYHVFTLTVNGKTGTAYTAALGRLWVIPTAD